MVKACEHCNKEYKTNDSRRKTCSMVCANIRRSENAWKPTQPEKTQPVVTKFDMSQLPPVEELPAQYVKRAHDLWIALTGDAPTRIA